MSEKELEDRLAADLRNARRSPNLLAHIKVLDEDRRERSFADLCACSTFDVLQNHVDWNTHKEIMDDLIGGMRPDIVIRSARTGQNRIYVEVKESTCLRYDTEDSQIIRYFLHLLSVSTEDENDIRRGIIVAAPGQRFRNSRTGTDWNYFVDRYSDLARKFRITFGALHIAV